jgi:hypothetical protein
VRTKDLGDLGARELLGQAAAGPERLPNFGARQVQPRRCVVRAALRRRQRAARTAVERRIQLERRDANLLGRELIEDPLRGQRLVVLADAGVIAADDERGDAVVLADHGVEDRFARAGVAHRGGECREDGAVARVVLLHQRLVRLEPHRRRHIILLGLADQRMNDQAVAHFERELREVLVRAVNRVARLEAGHAAPAERADLRAQLTRREAVVQERPVVAERQHAHGAADELLRPPQQIRRRRDARPRPVP